MANQIKIARLERKATSGDITSQFYLSIVYEDGRDNVRNLSKSFEWCIKAARAGDRQSQYRLSKKFESGSGLEKSDLISAVFWLEKAASSGYLQAKFELGYRLLFGVSGAQKSLTKAKRWLASAARDGHSEANYYLGYLYLNGLGFAENTSAAFYFFSKAASLNSAKAQCSLAFMFEHGIGCQANYLISIQLYEQSANQGHAGAQFSLGCLYMNQGNSKQAIAWLEKAAKNSVSPAQAILAQLYMNGIEVKKDFVKALSWCFVVQMSDETDLATLQIANSCYESMAAFAPQSDMDAAYTVACNWLEQREEEQSYVQIDWVEQIKKGMAFYANKKRWD